MKKFLIQTIAALLILISVIYWGENMLKKVFPQNQGNEVAFPF